MIGQKSFKKLAVSIAVAGSLFAQSVWSLGLGEIKSKAKLNQPLKAQIRLLSSKDFDISDLKARIASQESYTKYGVAKESFHNAFDFEVATLADGTKVINVTSKTPIREPFVNFLVELNWPQGRMLREYTILLDPPVYTDEQQTVTAPVATPRATTQRRSSNRVSQPQRQSERKKVSKPRAKIVFDGDALKVGRGQTLWSIATQVRPEGATVQQTLAALYRNNPNAFINNDIDRLKAGARLSVPTGAKIAAVDKNINYNSLKKKKSSDSAPLDVRKTVAEKSTSDNQNSGGRLTISSVTDADDMSSSGALAGEGLAGDGTNVDVVGLQEKVESLTLENEALKQKLQALNDGESAGLAVEDATLSVISGSAKAQDADDEALQSLVSQTDVENLNHSELSGDSNTVSSAESTKETTPDSANKTTPPITKKAPVKKAKVEKSFWQKEGFWKWPLIILGGLLGLVGLGVFAKRRFASMNEDISDFDLDNISSKPTASKEPSFKDQPIETPEVESDPLVEADIKIARGQLDDASELLETALTNDPDNQDLRVKLMELYQVNEQPEKLTALYEQLPEDFDHDSPLGLKVAALMGSVQTVQSAELSEKIDAYIESELPDENAVFGDAEEVADEIIEEAAAEEYELPESAASTLVDNQLDAPVSDVADDEDYQEIDLSDELEDALDPSSKQESTEDLVDEMLEQENDSSDGSATQSEGLSLVDDNHDDDDSLLDDSEAKTKLELARAYMEMGDYDSSRDILEEVKKDGSEELKQMADDLLAKI